MKRLSFFGFCLLVVCLLSIVGCEMVEEPPEPAEETEPPPPDKPDHGDFVLIPAGEFEMGSDERPERAKNTPAFYEPAHKVELPAYEIGVYEVTNGEFTRFQVESDYVAEGDWRSFYTIGVEEFHPVANVTYDDAKAYCEWIGGRLPTEPEWEKAARGPEGNAYPWGNEFEWGKANTNEKSADTVEVGSSDDLSGYGVYDMLGNVWEWTDSKLRPYPKNPDSRNVNYRKGYIVVRGASYAIKGASAPLYVRAAYLPKAQYGMGFRCAKDVESEGQGEGN